MPDAAAAEEPQDHLHDRLMSVSTERFVGLRVSDFMMEQLLALLHHDEGGI
jgi:hypothetical protein